MYDAFEKSLVARMLAEPKRPVSDIPFAPGDRVRNRHISTMVGVIVDDPDTEHGTVALTYGDSSQVWYVSPDRLELVSRGEDE
jgi:hypothetical protein